MQRKHAFLTGLVLVAYLPMAARPAAAQATVSFGADRPAAQSSDRGSPHRVPFPVRVRLVDELPRAGVVAAVSRVPGPEAKFAVEVRRRALSASVLASAFGAIPSAAQRQAKYPAAKVVIFVSEQLRPGKLAGQDGARFERLVQELLAKRPGEFVDIDPRGE